MEKGLMGGKVFSSRTIEAYTFYAEPFIGKHKKLSIETLKAELLNIPAENFSKRLKLYEAIVCFGKLLLSEGALEAAFLNDAKNIRPKRHIPPKRLTVNARELEALEKACKAAEDKALLLLLVNTGLRASECCALKLEDIDAELGTLTVKCGKGGKTRRVGLSPKVFEALNDYLKGHPKPTLKQYLFLNTEGKQLSRHGLYQRLERIGKLAGIKISPHSLRRAFVTINANAGRPLQMLQMACGHSDIKTTMGYCRTSEQEMITAMKEW